MGDDLKFIDFHQLQIENKRHVSDIEDRNKKLLSLKLNSTKTVQTLNGLKKKLADALRENERTATNLGILDIKQSKTEKAIHKTKYDIEKETINNRKQRALTQQITNMPDPTKFV